MPYKCFYSQDTSCRFSLTEVLLNSINTIKNKNEAIIVWTTCDVLFDKNFFQEIINHYQQDFCGTSHPHLTYSNLHSLKNNKQFRQIPAEGIDTIFFDANIFNNEHNKQIIQKYYFKNWGIFEHFLIAFGKKYSAKMINLWNVVNILKIQNNRILNKESDLFFTESLNYNNPIFYKFIKEEKINKKYKRLFYCHRQFEVIDKYNYYKKFIIFNLIYFIKELTPIQLKVKIKKILKINISDFEKIIIKCQ